MTGNVDDHEMEFQNGSKKGTSSDTRSLVIPSLANSRKGDTNASFASVHVAQNMEKGNSMYVDIES